MSNKVLRYISDMHCQIYRLRGGKLNHIETGSLQHFAAYNITTCILGPTQFVWGEILLDQDEFTTDPDMFLFAQDTILLLDQIQFLPPYQINGTQSWRQIWVDGRKLDAIWQTFPKLRQILPEITCISPPTQTHVWLAGPDMTGRVLQDQVTYEFGPVANDLPQTLEGFVLHRNADGFACRSKRAIPIISVILAACITLTLPWVDVVFSAVLGSPPSPQVVDNTINFPEAFQKFAPVIKAAKLIQFEVNSSSNTMSFTWDPNDSKILQLIPDLKLACQERSCTINEADFEQTKRLVIKLEDKK